MVAIRGLCIRNLKTVAYVLVVGICAYGLCQLLHPIFRQRRVRTQVPGIYNFSGANERNEDEGKPMTNTDEHDRLLFERQTKRKERVQQVCEELRRNSSNKWWTSNRTSRWSFHQMFVDDDHRLLYCAVPKVACTNWKRVLLTLSGKVKSAKIQNLVDNDFHRQLAKTYLRRLDSYTLRDIQLRLNSYYKFMFVREPFERLLSAYRNKLASAEDEEFRRLYGRDIIRRYRKRPSVTSLQRGHDVTFEEFVRYLLGLKTARLETFEPHWRPYHQLCHPCHVDYDFIGKYETLDEEVDFVLHRLGISHIVSFPTKTHSRSRTSKELVAEQFANISRSDIRRLWEIYSVDFNLFDYEYPEYK